MREHERERTVALLDGFITQVIDQATADQRGVDTRLAGPPRHHIGRPDAVIAASAFYANAALGPQMRGIFPAAGTHGFVGG